MDKSVSHESMRFLWQHNDVPHHRRVLAHTTNRQRVNASKRAQRAKLPMRMHSHSQPMLKRALTFPTQLWPIHWCSAFTTVHERARYVIFVVSVSCLFIPCCFVVAPLRSALVKIKHSHEIRFSLLRIRFRLAKRPFRTHTQHVGRTTYQHAKLIFQSS